MSGFLLRIVINAVVLFWLMIKLPGVFVDTLGGILLGAAIIGLANALINPLLSMFDVVPSRMRLGALTICMNSIIPVLVVKTLPGFQISSMLASIAGFMLINACSFTLSRVIRDR